MADPARVKTEELIAALEAATGPSDSLDLSIAEWCFENGTVAGINYDPEMWIIRHGGEFTSSIDFALMLVPEGWRWSLDWTQRPPYQDCGRADLYAPGNGIKPPDVCDVYAATPAIALCIAALKARTTP